MVLIIKHSVQLSIAIELIAIELLFCLTMYKKYADLFSSIAFDRDRLEFGQDGESSPQL